MVVHYPRTVWKNSYAEHEVTGKTNKEKNRKKEKETNTHETHEIKLEHPLKPMKVEENGLCL